MSLSHSFALLTLENIETWAKKTKTPLTNKHKQDLSIILSKQACLNLNVQLERFNNIITDNTSYPGLKEKERNELIAFSKKISALQKKYIQKNRGYQHISVEPELIQNLKDVENLYKTTNWWELNMDALNTDKFWEHIKAEILFQKEGKKKSASNNHIETLKMSWKKQSIFAGYTATQLCEAYESFILPMAEHLEKEANKKYHPILSAFLAELVNSINEMKYQAIYAMTHRLECAQYFNDIECDDVISYICAILKADYGMDLKKTGIVPELRQSLSPADICQMQTKIKAYIQENKKENLQEKFNNLVFNTLPDKFIKQASESEIAYVKNNPIICYTLHQLPKLMTTLEKMKNQSALDFIKNIRQNSFELQKTKKLIIYFKEALSNIKKAPICKQELTLYKNKYKEFIIKIEESLINEIEDKISIFLNSLPTDNYKEIKKLVDTVNYFYKTYAKMDYHFSTDLILAIASKLKDAAKYNTAPNEETLKHFTRIIYEFYPLSVSQKKRIEADFLALPKTLKKMWGKKPAEVLHYLVFYIEKSIISSQDIPHSLKRHKYIANEYNESWKNLSQEDLKTKDEHFNQLINYAKNVPIKLIGLYECITLDNFNHIDKNPITLEINKYSNTHQAEVIAIKNQLDLTILEKLSDPIIIKEYLCLDKTKKINLKKLSSLLERANRFFMDKNLYDGFTKSIKEACMQLLQGHCLYLIKEKEEISLSYLNKIEILLNTDISNFLKENDSILGYLEKYINVYDGSNNNIMKLIMQLLPLNNNNDCHPLLLSYAKKRLDYIANAGKSISKKDYEFFKYCSTNPEINKEFLTKQKENQVCNREEWKKKSLKSKMIKSLELFGSDEDILEYRKNRIDYFLSFINENNKNIVEKFQLFLETTNHHRKFDDHLLPPTYMINKKSLEYHLNKYINENNCSTLLKKIVKNFGNQTQIAQINYLSALRHIENRENFDEKELEIILENNCIEMYGNRLLNIEPDLKAGQALYHQLFGEKNCKIIFEKLQILLTQASTFNQSKTPEANFDFDELKKTIKTLKLFSHFYECLCTDKQHLSLIENIHELEKKVMLHLDLKNMLEKNNGLKNVSGKNIKLHNLILSLTKIIDIIPNKEKLSAENIDHYLLLCSKNILGEISNILNTEGFPDKETLPTLINLLFYLASTHVKLLLLEAHKEEITENPHWLTLINHYEERKKIKTLEDDISKDGQSHYSETFQNMLTFAKQFNEIKHFTHLNFKKQLFADSGISIALLQEANNLHTLFEMSKIKDKELSLFWSLCAQNLQDKHLEQYTPEYLIFLIDILRFTSDKLIDRALESKHDLPPKIITTSIKIEQHLPTTFKKVANDHHSFLLWQPYSFSDNFHTMKLIKTIEAYASKIVGKDELLQFRKISNDAIIKEQDDTTTLTSLKNSFLVKKEKDQLKLLAASKLHGQFCRFLNSEAKTQSVTQFTEEILNNIPQNFKSKTLNNLIKSLKEASVSYAKEAIPRTNTL